MKIVINKCFGGFRLSQKALQELQKCNDKLVDESDGSGIFHDSGELYASEDLERNNPDLIRIIEQLGSEANGYSAELTIVEIPDNVKWVIMEYDGQEWVAEQHRCYPNNRIWVADDDKGRLYD